MIINLLDSELNTIESKIKDSWFYLLVFYDSIRLNLYEMEESILNKSILEAIKYENPIVLSLDIQLNEKINLPVILENKEVGFIQAIYRQGKNASFQEFLDYVPKAADIRKIEANSSLLPDGLIYISQNINDFWLNNIAKEILSSLDMTAHQLILTLFGGENSTIGSLIDNKSVQVVERTMRQFEITGIAIPVCIDKIAIGLFLIISDSTVIHQKDKELVSKSAMILEIHHRVKNNLQTIASLLRIQMRHLNSKTLRKAYIESINRITSIAIIHEELSRVGLDEINLKVTIRNIMEMILGNMVDKTKDISGEISGDDIYVSADKASVLALCITELLQNAVEHAFPFRRKGSIHVNIEESEGEIIVSVDDDGIGFNPQKSRTSLGLEIIDMLTEETLKGRFYTEGHTYGTNSKIIIPSEILREVMI